MYIFVYVYIYKPETACYFQILINQFKRCSNTIRDDKYLYSVYNQVPWTLQYKSGDHSSKVLNHVNPREN